MDDTEFYHLSGKLAHGVLDLALEPPDLMTELACPCEDILCKCISGCMYTTFTPFRITDDTEQEEYCVSACNRFHP